MLIVEIVIIAALILVNGFLAMSEIALVASRPARLNALAEQGIHGARRACRLAADSARYLSTVQIGITLVGVLSGAFSGATLGVRLAERLAGFGLPGAAAETMGIGIVVVAITYCTLVIGELVPKQLALRDPEMFAARVAPAMVLLSRVTAPLVWVLSTSARAVLRAAGQPAERAPRITDEEIETILAEAESAGVIEPDERRMIAGVMRLGDREVRLVMSPRREVDWIDLAADPAAARRTLAETQHSHLPAANGDPDRMVGLVRTRELLTAMLHDEPLKPANLVRQAPVVGDRASALEVLTSLRDADVPLAIVEDESGRFQGVITPVDILNAIAGLVRVDLADEPQAVQRADGSWLLAGSLPAGEMAQRLGIEVPADLADRSVAVFIQRQLGRLPETGETVEAYGWRFEVVDLDGRRIDKVLASALGG